MRKAIITGTFDPVTRGHTDVIYRASRMFDQVYVCVLNNGEKRTMFTEDERLRIMQTAVKGLCADNVTAEAYGGLTSDYMKDHGITYIVKGVRNSTDFDYEYGMAQIMDKFLSGCETVLLPSKPEFIHISSTFVREIIKYGGPLEDAVPAGTADMIREIYSMKGSVK